MAAVYHFRVNKILMLVGVAAAAVAVWLLLSRAKDPTSIAADRAGSGSAMTNGSAATTPNAKPKPVDKVGRVSPEERKRLAEQIAKAKANRPPSSRSGTSSTTPRPELADNGDAKLVRTTMKDAMKEIIPYLADCYDKAGDKVPAEIKVLANMTLTGDPDIGTIIDTKGLADGDGKPLEPTFDLCLKDAFVSLQMPPLSEGGEVQVTYPFVFARNGPEETAGSGNLPP
jgi:hypothetical protein